MLIHGTRMAEAIETHWHVFTYWIDSWVDSDIIVCLRWAYRKCPWCYYSITLSTSSLIKLGTLHLRNGMWKKFEAGLHAPSNPHKRVVHAPFLRYSDHEGVSFRFCVCIRESYERCFEIFWIRSEQWEPSHLLVLGFWSFKTSRI